MNMLESQGKKNIFVTVGTTQFDELVTEVLHPDMLEVMESKGYTHLIIQIGRGLEPQIPTSRRIQITLYHLKENISSDIEDSSLVISHAGAGSCLEVLNAHKPLIVVVNQKLMGNHQLELAEKLQSERHVVMCYPETLKTTLSDFDTSCLKILHINNQMALSNYIEKLMGF
ncbi:UDP-N-acetylglucosamine transferase subunit ALG13 homolog [Daphnia carinata]|uniref:UDP-N-acetylglucosamine transferase subunit ALG13 homolog n=1 Tax=Daphnia carinata TaxID=120202 RepID=UPI00257B0644|nr:UDP-N-acetylglucosamine transferase subunit ALG13 homolog [Daphnia carinata]